MRVGIIGTGAISHKHAAAYRNIGFELTVCTDIHEESGRAFADQHGCEFVRSFEDLCRHSKVDYVDVCTFPDFRLQPLRICAESKKHIQVQKPIATNLKTAGEMVDTANKAGIQLGVVSQHRFDDSTQFLRKALNAGRLGQILQADAYVKWFRSAARELGDRRWRCADQPGRSSGGCVAVADRACCGSVRLLATRCFAQDRI
jgi:UDP-N-acetyl-2-amino-2-deoxyglucuronate dehydrogenase